MKTSNFVTNQESDISPLTCTLSCRELQQRKETVFAELNKKRISKTELSNGYAFEFLIDEDIEDQIRFFVESEKECCSFFRLNVTKDESKGLLRLEILGPNNVKSFIDITINI